MKKHLLTAILLIFGISANAEVLQGGISYDINSARTELMDTVSYNIDPKFVDNFIFDLEHEQNVNFMLEGMTELKDRTLAYFSDNTYAVYKHIDPYHVYYYDKNGMLNYVEEKESLKYPYKSYKYDISKKLVNMSMRVSDAETFIYSKDGKLLAHWLKDKAYDEQGNVIMKRKYVGK